MKMPSGPSEKSACFSPPLAFLLAKTYDATLTILQPLEPFLPGCSFSKVWISNLVQIPFIFI